MIPQTLLSTIPFYLLRVALAILFPVLRVCLAPLLRAFQTNLPINRIGGDLLPMIITLALPLACGLVTDRLLRMISRRLKDLLTVTATEIFHQATQSTLEVFSRKTPLDVTRPQQQIEGCSDRKRPHDYAELRCLQGYWISKAGLEIGCRRLPRVYVRIYNAFGSKSDKVDARKLAELLRGGLLRPVYHGEMECGRCGSWGVVTRPSAKIYSES